jgi:hypothetical protein
VPNYVGKAETDQSVGFRNATHLGVLMSTPDSWVSALDRRFQATIGRCQDSKFEVRSGTCWRRSAPGSSRREQPFFNPMQTFPSGFGEGRVGANNIADHLPGREVERTLRRRSHGQRNRALRAETDALGRGFLPRPYTRRLCEHKHGHRFLSGLDLTAAAKAIQIVQRLRLLLSTKFCSRYCLQDPAVRTSMQKDSRTLRKL